jgi:hypothetical protein
MKFVPVFGLLLALKSFSDCMLLVWATYGLFAGAQFGFGIQYAHAPFILATLLFGLNVLLVAGFLTSVVQGRIRFRVPAICHLIFYLAIYAATLLTPAGPSNHDYANPTWVPDSKYLSTFLHALAPHMLVSICSCSLFLITWRFAPRTLTILKRG